MGEGVGVVKEGWKTDLRYQARYGFEFYITLSKNVYQS